MIKKENNPKQQHYVPKLLLKHFTGPNSQLNCWRKGEGSGGYFVSTPNDVFTRKHLYSRVGADGTRDHSLEDAYSALEGHMGALLKRMIEIVRSGQRPRLTRTDWQIWLNFYYTLMGRNPIDRAIDADKLNLLGQAQDVLAVVHSTPGVSPTLLGAIPSADELVRYVTLNVQGSPPSPRCAEWLCRSGLLILRVEDERKALVVGDRPGVAEKFLLPDGTFSEPARFIPMASDIAFVPIAHAPMHLEVQWVSSAQVRRMNEATTTYSRTIAGRSAPPIHC